jgi:hypothetical protein
MVWAPLLVYVSAIDKSTAGSTACSAAARVLRAVASARRRQLRCGAAYEAAAAKPRSCGLALAAGTIRRDLAMVINGGQRATVVDAASSTDRVHASASGRTPAVADN